MERNNKTIIITGGQGVLGTMFTELFPEHSIPLTKYDLDITKIDSITHAIEYFRPRFILNCAALTDMDYCETHPDQCIAVNTNGILNIKTAIGKRSVKLILISTDAAIDPVSVYGKSKYMAEKNCESTDLIIRTTFYHHKDAILKGIIDEMPLSVRTDIFFNPVSVLTLAQHIDIHKKSRGLINLFSNKRLSKYEFACQVARTFNRKTQSISGSSFDTKPRSAPRKPDSYTQSDIDIDINRDLRQYKKYLKRRHSL